MLRAVVVVLLVANLGYYLWTHDALAVFGMEPARVSESEPQRLLEQVRPELLRLGRDAAPPVVKP